MNQDWVRWIIASTAKQFDNLRQGLPMFMEGMDHIEGETDYIEVRLDGPYIVELSAFYYRMTMEVNVLVHSAKSSTDLYKIYRDVGIVVKAFGPPLPVYKYGLGDNDDQSLLGCMTLIRSNDEREALRVSHFGQYNPSVPVMRSSVEGHYHMFLKGV